jgi:hypothetical protein
MRTFAGLQTADRPGHCLWVQASLGDLDRVERIVKVFGMVNVAPGFNPTPAVLDGCSDLLVEVFGDAGRHTRTASAWPSCRSTSRSRSR